MLNFFIITTTKQSEACDEREILIGVSLSNGLFKTTVDW